MQKCKFEKWHMRISKHSSKYSSVPTWVIHHVEPKQDPWGCNEGAEAHEKADEEPHARSSLPKAPVGVTLPSYLTVRYRIYATKSIIWFNIYIQDPENILFSNIRFINHASHAWTYRNINMINGFIVTLTCKTATSYLWLINIFWRYFHLIWKFEEKYSVAILHENSQTCHMLCVTG